MKVFNNHNLYILGAGFSYEMNMPLMSTFMTDLKNAYNWYPEKSNGKTAIKSILDFRQKATSSAYRVKLDLDNIEDLFSLAATEEAENLNQLKTGLGATLTYCKQTNLLQPKITFSANDAIPYFNIKEDEASDVMGGLNPIKINKYDYIASVIGGINNKEDKQYNSVISFNYDT